VCPLSINASKYWSVKSWDGFQIPKPGATLTVVFGKPITVPKNLEGEEIEKWRLVLENALNEITVDKEN
jgi:lysophospholipid acyltransferase (LPLAT)-like uncharacterized protein